MSLRNALFALLMAATLLAAGLYLLPLLEGEQAGGDPSRVSKEVSPRATNFSPTPSTPRSEVNNGSSTAAALSIHTSRDFFQFSQDVLRRYGQDSSEYASIRARIELICESSWKVLEDPHDKFGVDAPQLDVARLLEPRCLNWWERASQVPEAAVGTSRLFATAVSDLSMLPDGTYVLDPESPAVSAAVRQIKQSTMASDFSESLLVWWDANPKMREDLIRTHRLREEDLALSVTLGSRLLECEVERNCGSGSIAALEFCLQYGCSARVSLQEALRSSLPPATANAAFSVRNQLVSVRSGS